jgi:hypothetical protein
MDQALFQPLIQAGVAPEDVNGLAGFFHVAISDSLYHHIATSLGEADLARLNQLGEDQHLNDQQGVKLLETAYFKKTGKTFLQISQELLINYIHTLADLIKQGRQDFNRLAQADQDTLKNLETAMTAKDWPHIKAILDQVLATPQPH